MLRFFLTIILFSISQGYLFAQGIEQILEKLNNHSLENPQEKIYIHTDRNSYTAGETIFFKSYNTIDIHNNLSLLSQINYVELIDPRQKIVKDALIGTNIGIGVGSIELADTLVEGTYRLRAYTSWMRNFDADYFFEKNIYISNGRLDNVLAEAGVKTEGNKQFYTIRLTTLSGTPLADTRVRFAVLEGEKIVDKGNERTDENGQLKIDINNKNQGKDIQLSFAKEDKRQVSKVIHTKVFDSDNSLQVLPEGGPILLGQLSNLGLKALKPNGRGIKAEIDLIDTSGQIIRSGTTNHLGMGQISFIPDAASGYKIKARFSDGSEKEIPIPEIVSSGYSLNVNNLNPQKLYAQVNLSADLVSDQELFFVVHHLGTSFYVSKQKQNKQNIVFSVDKQRLPTGVLTVAILDHTFKPIFERPVFIYNKENALQLKPSLNKESFNKRDLVEVNLESGDQADSLRIAAFSASVVNLDKVTDANLPEANILSSLLLEADLNGHIESPGYYFNSSDSINFTDLDYLLMTQGWCTINWDVSKLIEEEKPFKAEKGITIKGHTRKIGRKAAAPNSRVQLISANNFIDFIDTVANAEGFFSFENLIFPDSAKFLISARDEKDKRNIDIIMEDDGIPVIESLQMAENGVNTRFLKELNHGQKFFKELESKGLMSSIIDIEEIVVSRVAKKAPEHSRNLNGPGSADQILVAEDLETCPTLEMCLSGRLMGVVFQNGIPHNTRGMAPMQVVLDGMYVEADMLSSISAADVASVEVLRNANYTAIYGSYGGNGLLIITTKIGREGRTNYTPKGLLSIEPRGISTSKEFYKPVYEIDTETSYQNDLRTTIHWEPTIATDASGKASFNFYTSDEPGKYRITIEGVGLNGKVTRKIVEFDVK